MKISRKTENELRHLRYNIFNALTNCLIIDAQQVCVKGDWINVSEAQEQYIAISVILDRIDHQRRIISKPTIKGSA